MKLYLVTRRDLSPGDRASQLCHAMRLFVEEHPVIDAGWYKQSNTLVLLEVEDEAALRALKLRIQKRDVPCSAFHEPDLNNAFTALAVAPSGRSSVAHLPKAFSGSVAQR